jgi:hypothetical protein
MTALTMSARPEKNASLRPVPWRRMAWVTWRQHRAALGGAAVLLGAWAAYLWLRGLQLHHAYAAVAACRPASSIACTELADTFNSTYMSNVATNLIQAAPALIGAFVGAPVLARELETGTFRYAWTLSLGRLRWTLGKLVPLAIVLAAAAWACSLLFSWYNQPFFAEGKLAPLSPELFDLRGVAFAAWTLGAFAIGVLAGMLIRRAVPAIAATLIVYGGLAFAAGAYLRQHYMTPLVTKNLNPPGAAWITSQFYASDGKPVSQSVILQALRDAIPPGQPIVKFRINPAQYLIQHGYTLWTSYEPASRFWPFQWIEGGWLLALSVLLITATIWLVRRRAI